MGMFDHFIVQPPLELHCPAGHLLKDFQTKDLENNLDTYYLYEGFLFSRGRQTEEAQLEVEYRGGNLLLTSREMAIRVDHVGDVCIYTHCDECIPVYTEGHGRGIWGSDLVEHNPWEEWVLHFNKVLTGYSAVTWESHEDVKKKLLHDGLRPLPDDDRVVLKHLEQRAKKR